ncbi:hypothetical protein WR25_26811 [Diploscapter pachys]|uniref:Uncharacterized protein n=1 Tax=Diploscapter pachys TaxID=2018661 RepID=A0A2A2KKZ9_9BILA|nr:hypothetical protein WR25_26811 [Diploscapter pachys]
MSQEKYASHVAEAAFENAPPNLPSHLFSPSSLSSSRALSASSPSNSTSLTSDTQFADASAHSQAPSPFGPLAADEQLYDQPRLQQSSAELPTGTRSDHVAHHVHLLKRRGPVLFSAFFIDLEFSLSHLNIFCEIITFPQKSLNYRNHSNTP